MGRIRSGELSHTDILQLDGAFAAAHINYGNSPVFNGNSAGNLKNNTMRHHISNKDDIEDIISKTKPFDGTESYIENEDLISTRILTSRSSMIVFIRKSSRIRR